MGEEYWIQARHTFNAPLSRNVSFGFSFKDLPLEHSRVGFGDAAA